MRISNKFKMVKPLKYKPKELCIRDFLKKIILALNELHKIEFKTLIEIIHWNFHEMQRY